MQIALKFVTLELMTIVFALTDSDFTNLAYNLLIIIFHSSVSLYPLFLVYKNARHHVLAAEGVVTLEAILMDPELKEKLKVFLTSEHSLENLLFLDAVEDFKLKFSSQPDTINVRTAHLIYEKYIDQASSCCVNLPSILLKDLTDRLTLPGIETATHVHVAPQAVSSTTPASSATLNAHIFDFAVVNIKQLVRTDCLPRFLRKLQSGKH